MSVTPQLQAPTQNSSLLTKLPRELRDMIYEQVFAGNSEIVIPHPLTQTSKQLREEAMPIAARNIASRAMLMLTCRPCSRDYQVDTFVTMYDLEGPCHRRFIPLFTEKRPRPYPRARILWRDLCCSEFGKQMIPHIRHMRIIIFMEHLHEIIVGFSRNSAPETTIENDHYDRRNDVEFRRMCLSIAEKYHERKAACSAKWVDAFMRDIVDAWFIVVHDVSR